MKQSFEITDAEYRASAFLSNSDLSELFRWLTGTKFTASPKSLWFGTVWHKRILEPKKFSASDLDLFSSDEIFNLIESTNAVADKPELVSMLESGTSEIVRHWIDKLTGISCKCRIDHVDQSSRHLVDFKTTACKTESDFQKSCYEYEYNRQGAFYLESDAKAEIFELIGVQKVAPYNIYRLPFHRQSDFINKGRKRMRYLMQFAQEQLNRPDGWRPSSWHSKTPKQL